MRINILGVGFDNVTMDEALARGEELLCSEGAHYVVTPNPEIVETCRARGAISKVIFENCYLTQEEKIAAQKFCTSRSEAACPASSSARA